VDRKRVLVVDDEVYILQILEFSLEMEGFEVATAQNGEEAIAQALENPPDLVVLDIMMPRMDGYEACRRLKTDPRTQNTPVILLSAKGRSIDQEIGFEAGAEEYITKPFSPRKLVERIKALLTDRDLRPAVNE
jgi:two-component system alkaline phosphatase synthesis response regulator PhoP